MRSNPVCSVLSLLRGAEHMGMHKAVKPQFGGGMRRFSCDEDNIYENIESELCFFTSQVRDQNTGLYEWSITFGFENVKMSKG